MPVDRRFGKWLLVIVAVLAGVLASGAMVWRASETAFSGVPTSHSGTQPGPARTARPG